MLIFPGEYDASKKLYESGRQYASSDARIISCLKIKSNKYINF